MMGDHKWVHRGEVDPKLDTIYSLKPGETTGVIESKDGYCILRVNGHRPKHQMTWAEMHILLRAQLEKARSKQLAEQFDQTLRKKAKLEL